jgi:FtsZ-interacting cell division protein ZipA
MLLLLLLLVLSWRPRKRWINVDSGQLVGIIVGIVVVLAIVAVAIYLSRKRKTAADRNRAAEMREKAETDQLAARDHEAKAARADADAKAAEVEAERLRRQARGTQQEAQTVRAGAEEQLRKADDVDPDVVTTERGDSQAHDAQPQEELRRDRGDRERPAGTGDAAGIRENTAAERRDTDGPNGERPRNL